MRQATPTTAVAPHFWGAERQTADTTRLQRFLSIGVDLAGPSGLATVAVLTAPAPEAFAWSVANRNVLRMLVEVAQEFADRSLSRAERMRTAAVILIAAVRVQEQLERGGSVRRDDFFTAEPGARSAADECAEAVVLAAQREPEEAKLPLLGALLANITFREGIERAEALSLVRLAATLSHRQLGLLGVFSHTERLELRTTDYHGGDRVPFATVAVLHEVFDLVRMSLVVQTNGDPVTIRDLTPGRMTAAGFGAMLCKLMGLDRRDADEIASLAASLR